MAMMRIYCDYCGQKWEVYQRDDLSPSKAGICPHCKTKIDRNTWNDHIIPAFEAFKSINNELINNNMTGSPRFSVDFVDDFYFPESKIKANNED